MKITFKYLDHHLPFDISEMVAKIVYKKYKKNIEKHKKNCFCNKCSFIRQGQMINFINRR